MVRSGERTGNLDDTLDELASYYERQHALKKKIQSTMAYPIVLSVLIVAVLVFMMIVIVPQFENVFESFGGELPFITKWVIGLSGFIQHFWWLIVLVVAAIVIGFALAYKN